MQTSNCVIHFLLYTDNIDLRYLNKLFFCVNVFLRVNFFDIYYNFYAY